jgi:uncharacterized membrane protein YeaQ/YmgE (transglycosylase-associated protein family)
MAVAGLASEVGDIYIASSRQRMCEARVNQQLLPERKTMNFIIWLIIGGVIGWLASIVMRHPEGMVLNVVIGIVGAMLGGWLISPLLGAGTINQNDFSLTGLVVSFLGAIILLAIVNLIQRGRTR